jgi:hypothetical protein
MTIYEAIGYELNQCSAVIVLTGNRIYHGLRLPSEKGVLLPAINYYKLSGNNLYLDKDTYTINCRANDINTAVLLSKMVKELFCGISGLGTYASETGIDISRISLVADHGVIPEAESGVYNAPVDILFVY